MGWSIGYDNTWKRDIGYGVPAMCDHPGCPEEIDRGLSYVCGGQPYGGEHGCGLYFCENHRESSECEDGCCVPLCKRCADQSEEPLQPFEATPDVPQWIQWKLTHESWQRWRDENPTEVTRLQASSSPPTSCDQEKP